MSELSSPQNLEEVCAYLELCVEEAKDKAWGEGISFALCFIKKLLLSAQSENDWIPVTKKAHPDEEGEYLVTDKGGGLATLSIDDYIFCDDGTSCWLYSQNVVAWKLPPEPYAERKEE